MVRTRLWSGAAAAALVCGVVWAAADPGARAGRAVPDAEAAQVYGGQTTPVCSKVYKSKPCDTGTNCSTNANTYEQVTKGATTSASGLSFVYCGTGMNCGFRYELSGCDIKKAE